MRLPAMRAISNNVWMKNCAKPRLPNQPPAQTVSPTANVPARTLATIRCTSGKLAYRQRPLYIPKTIETQACTGIATANRRKIAGSDSTALTAVRERENSKKVTTHEMASITTSWPNADSARSLIDTVFMFPHRLYF